MIRRILSYLYRSYNSKDKIFAAQIKSLIGRYPKNIELYKLALTHKSTSEASIKSNERLEYLGDALLATFVAEFLYYKYPTENEGFLTKMRAKIVRRKTLNSIADKIDLENMMTQFNEIQITESMKGNALEALIAAVFLENGYSYSRHFVTKNLLQNHIDIHRLENINENYKSILLEWCQKHGKQLTYGLVSKYRHNKRDRYKVSVLINEEEIAIADDYNKKSAEQKASKKAIKLLQISDS